MADSKIAATPRPAHPLWRRALGRVGEVVVIGAVSFGLISGYTSCRYQVPPAEAAGDAARDLTLLAIRGAVAVYDPCTPRAAPTGPADADPGGWAGWVPVEEAFVPGRAVTAPGGAEVTATAVRNEVIVRSPHRFRYQPYDDPRLQQLRTKYGLDAVVAPVPDELAGQVRLRGWARSRFRRADYQPYASNFDALDVLDRNLRDRGEPYDSARHFDPCHFFPLLFAQTLLAAGHQARLVSVGDHGGVEVWSNQYGKWVYMDAELNQHLEKDGVPLDMVELLEESGAAGPTRVRLVRGTQTSDPNTTMVHLKVPEVPAATLVTWFNRPLVLVDLRNDWLTNHYFRGHPARSEGSSLVYVDPRVAHMDEYGRRMRRTVSDRNKFYWTLNQARVLCKPCDGGAVELAFDTVTPNFQCFEYTVDANPPRELTASTFRWHLHGGTNTLRVRPVNRFGVRGRESLVELVVRTP
jgi:hypothetical protein